jgi:hypothetical protein
MRADRISLHKASRKFQIDPRTVVRWGGTALRKTASRRYVAKATDQLLRVLVVPTSKGLSEVAVSDSRQASTLGKYWSAVHRYLATGDASRIKKFEGKKVVDAEGQRVALLTDLRELDRLGSAHVLSFESLYGRTA